MNQAYKAIFFYAFLNTFLLLAHPCATSQVGVLSFALLSKYRGTLKMPLFLKKLSVLLLVLQVGIQPLLGTARAEGDLAADTVEKVGNELIGGEECAAEIRERQLEILNLLVNFAMLTLLNEAQKNLPSDFWQDQKSPAELDEEIRKTSSRILHLAKNAAPQITADSLRQIEQKQKERVRIANLAFSENRKHFDEALKNKNEVEQKILEGIWVQVQRYLKVKREWGDLKERALSEIQSKRRHVDVERMLEREGLRDINHWNRSKERKGEEKLSSDAIRFIITNYYSHNFKKFIYAADHQSVQTILKKETLDEEDLHRFFQIAWESDSLYEREEPVVYNPLPYEPLAAKHVIHRVGTQLRAIGAAGIGGGALLAFSPYIIGGTGGFIAIVGPMAMAKAALIGAIVGGGFGVAMTSAEEWDKGGNFSADFFDRLYINTLKGMGVGSIMGPLACLVGMPIVVGGTVFSLTSAGIHLYEGEYAQATVAGIAGLAGARQIAGPRGLGILGRENHKALRIFEPERAAKFFDTANAKAFKNPGRGSRRIFDPESGGDAGIAGASGGTARTLLNTLKDPFGFESYFRSTSPDGTTQLFGISMGRSNSNPLGLQAGLRDTGDEIPMVGVRRGHSEFLPNRGTLAKAEADTGVLTAPRPTRSVFVPRASDRQNTIFIDRNSGQIRQFVLPKTGPDDPDVVDLRGSSFVPVITEAPAITRRVAEPQDASNGGDSSSLTISYGRFFLSDEWEFNSSYLRGGMGSVYKATHKKTGEVRAVKVSNAKDPNSLRFAFLNRVSNPEAQAKYEQAKSRNVIEALMTAEVGNIRIFEFGVSAIKKEGIIEKSQPYIVMEWIEGEDLNDYIVSHHPNVREGAELLLKITRILKEYHNRGFVHRDLKPANIRIDRSGRVFILDNGLALILPNPIQPSLLNPQMNPVEDDGLSFGTVYYLSPEAARAEKDAYSGKMDIWSLALVWHELMTGRNVASFDVPQNQTIPPYLITDPGFVQQLINNLPNDLPQNLWRLFRKMLSEYPDRRPSVENIISELENFLGPAIPETQSSEFLENSKFRSVDIHGVNKIDDLFPPPLRNNGTKIVSLGCGQMVLWEKRLEDTYGVSVTGIDRYEAKPYAGRAKELRGGYIAGNFLTVPSDGGYDMVILNSPRLNWIESEPNDNFTTYGIAVERFLNPGGMGIILSEFTNGEDPVQALEKIFGPGNVRRLPAIEGYHLGLRKWQQPVSLQSNGDFFIVKKAPTSPSEN